MLQSRIRAINVGKIEKEFTYENYQQVVYSIMQFSDALGEVIF